MDVKLKTVEEACIRLAEKILNKNAAPTEETVRTARALIDIALDIEDLNLRAEFQSRYGAAAFRGHSSARTSKGN